MFCQQILWKKTGQFLHRIGGNYYNNVLHVTAPVKVQWLRQFIKNDIIPVDGE